MSVYPATFDFSDRSLRRQKRTNYMVAVTVMAVVLIGMLSASHFQAQYLGLSVLVSLIVFAVILLIFTLVNRIVVSRWRQMSLHLGTEGLVRKSGAVQQTISWDSITKVRLHDNPGGELRRIEVFTPDTPSLFLFGYEPMSEVAELIKEHVPPSAEVETKRHRFDMENPVIICAILVLAALFFGGLYRIAGETISQGLTSLIQIALGIFFLGYGPVSRTNPNLRRWEIGVGVFIVATALMTLILRIGLHWHLF